MADRIKKLDAVRVCRSAPEQCVKGLVFADSLASRLLAFATVCLGRARDDPRAAARLHPVSRASRRRHSPSAANRVSRRTTRIRKRVRTTGQRVMSVCAVSAWQELSKLASCQRPSLGRISWSWILGDSDICLVLLFSPHRTLETVQSSSRTTPATIGQYIFQETFHLLNDSHARHVQ